MNFKNVWFAAELLGAFGLMQRYKKNTEEWVHIQTAMIWLKSISFARDLVIYQVGISACVMLLVISAILMEVALLFCIQMSSQTRAIALFVVSGIDFAIALSLLGYVISAERWLKKATQYNACLEQVLKAEDGFENCVK